MVFWDSHQEPFTFEAGELITTLRWSKEEQGEIRHEVRVARNTGKLRLALTQQSWSTRTAETSKLSRINFIDLITEHQTNWDF
jgi:hypothetical protein